MNNKQTKKKSTEIIKIYDQKGEVTGYIKGNLILGLDFKLKAFLSSSKKGYTCLSTNKRMAYRYPTGDVISANNKYLGNIYKPKSFWAVKMLVFLFLVFVVATSLSLNFLAKASYPMLLSIEQDGSNWSKSQNINVFSSHDGALYPGVSGIYTFNIDNRLNREINYNVTFNEDNPKNMPMLFRLKIDGEDIAQGNWLLIEEIKPTVTALNKAVTIFSLEWKWDLNGFYDINTNISAEGIDYSLEITVSAAA